MKTTTIGIVSIFALLTPLVSMAQSAQITRAQVQSELVKLEKAGYNPARANDANYPDDLQAAEARIALHATSASMPGSGMGSSTGSIAQSGTRSTSRHSNSNLYEHH
jgi:hypothetical protein